MLIIRRLNRIDAASGIVTLKTSESLSKIVLILCILPYNGKIKLYMYSV